MKPWPYGSHGFWVEQRASMLPVDGASKGDGISNAQEVDNKDSGGA